MDISPKAISSDFDRTTTAPHFEKERFRVKSSRTVYTKSKSTNDMKNKQRSLPSIPLQKWNTIADNTLEHRSNAGHSHKCEYQIILE